MDPKLQKELETNDLALTAQDFWLKLKNGQLISPRVAGLAIAVALIMGLWWFLSSSRETAAAAQWREMDQLQSKKQLEEFAKAPNNTSTLAGKLARLQLARIQLDNQGIRKLNTRGEDRMKAVDAVETARKELESLVKEFTGDLTIKSQILELQAKAELALVGIPTAAGQNDSRGSVEKAVGYLKDVAATVGQESAAGKSALEQAKTLENEREEIIRLGQTLHSSLVPFIDPGLKTPDSLNPLGTPPGSGMKLPGNVEPAPAVPPSLPAPTVPPPAEKKADEKKADEKKPDAAAAVGGAGSAATPAKKN